MPYPHAAGTDDDADRSAVSLSGRLGGDVTVDDNHAAEAAGAGVAGAGAGAAEAGKSHDKKGP
jgi:hypothetical protein